MKDLLSFRISYGKSRAACRKTVEAIAAYLSRDGNPGLFIARLIALEDRIGELRIERVFGAVK